MKHDAGRPSPDTLCLLMLELMSEECPRGVRHPCDTCLDGVPRAVTHDKLLATCEEQYQPNGPVKKPRNDRDHSPSWKPAPNLGARETRMNVGGEGRDRVPMTMFGTGSSTQ